MELSTSELLSSIAHLAKKNNIQQRRTSTKSDIPISTSLKQYLASMTSTTTKSSETGSNYDDDSYGTPTKEISPIQSESTTTVNIPAEIKHILGDTLTTINSFELLEAIFIIFNTSWLMLPTDFKNTIKTEFKKQLALDLVYKDYYTIFKYNKRHINTAELQEKLLNNTSDMYVEKYITDYLNINIIVMYPYNKTYNSISEYNKHRITIILLKSRDCYKPVLNLDKTCIFDHDVIKLLMTEYTLHELSVNKVLVETKKNMLDICKYKLSDLQKMATINNIPILHPNNKKRTKTELYADLKSLATSQTF